MILIVRSWACDLVGCNIHHNNNTPAWTVPVTRSHWIWPLGIGGRVGGLLSRYRTGGLIEQMGEQPQASESALRTAHCGLQTAVCVRPAVARWERATPLLRCHGEHARYDR